MAEAKKLDTLTTIRNINWGLVDEVIQGIKRDHDQRMSKQRSQIIPSQTIPF